MTSTILRLTTLGSLMMVMVALGGGIAAAQEQKKTGVFNSGGQGGGVFSNLLSRQQNTGMQSATISTSPQAIEKARVDFERARAEQEARNQQVIDSRLATIKAEFDTKIEADIAADNARWAAERAKLAGTGPAATSGGMSKPAAAPNANPYAGSNVVFTGKKKEEDPSKPTRLFNTR